MHDKSSLLCQGRYLASMYYCLGLWSELERLFRSIDCAWSRIVWCNMEQSWLSHQLLRRWIWCCSILLSDIGFQVLVWMLFAFGLIRRRSFSRLAAYDLAWSMAGNYALAYCKLYWFGVLANSSGVFGSSWQSACREAVYLLFLRLLSEFLDLWRGQQGFLLPYVVRDSARITRTHAGIAVKCRRHRSKNHSMA